MRWQERNKMSVLVLDGSERLAAFPRLAIFAVDGGAWSACVIAAPGRREWIRETFRTEEDAKRACLRAARPQLPRRWHPPIDAALAALGDEPTGTDTRQVQRVSAAPAVVRPPKR